jgi:hypothetical protein
MIFSLPSYRRLSQADLDGLRKDSDQTNAARVSRVLLNILLLTGLWALPFYLRSLVLPEQSDTINPSEAIIGRWQLSTGDGQAIEFTSDGEFQLSRGGIVELTAHYRFDQWGDVVLYDLNPPPIFDHKETADAQYRFTISFTGNELTLTAPRQQLDFRQLALFGSVAHFKRAQ